MTAYARYGAVGGLNPLKNLLHCPLPPRSEMKIFKLFITGVILLLFCGCASEYTPNTDVAFDAIHEFSGKGSVNLINGQPSTDRTFFYTHHYANPHTWTDLAIQIAGRELAKRGISVSSNTPKALTLSIESANTDVGWVKFTSDITMLVRASNGYTKTYTGEDFSYIRGDPPAEMDTALMKVVAAMLDDPQIVAFLKK